MDTVSDCAKLEDECYSEEDSWIDYMFKECRKTCGYCEDDSADAVRAKRKMPAYIQAVKSKRAAKKPMAMEGGT